MSLEESTFKQLQVEDQSLELLSAEAAMCQIFCVVQSDLLVPFFYHLNVTLHVTYRMSAAALSLNPSRFPVTLPVNIYSII